MPPSEKLILTDILKKRIESLGYPSLKKFHQDHPEIGFSYELLRQVVYGGRVPRAETLLAVLRAMRFPPSQVRKILELCIRGFPLEGRREPDPAGRGDAEERDRAGKAMRQESGEPGVSVPSDNGERISPPQPGEDPAEILAGLTRSLPRIPRRGNEDFWETLHALALLAERKASRQAKREAEQPLLFGKEPEAVYHFLVRKGTVPSYMSKGEPVPLSFAEGIEYRDRFRGALLGAGIGEMLGRRSQGLSPKDVEALFGRIESCGGLAEADAGPPSLLLLARVLLREKMLDPDAAAAAYASESRGGGSSGGEFARNLLERGYPWFEAGNPEPSCAPAARIAPLALLRAGDSRRMRLEAGIEAAITHPAAASIAGSVAQATAIARLLHTPAGGLDVIGFGRSLSHAVSGIEPDRGGRGKSGRPSPTLWRKLGTELTALLLRRAEIEEIRELLGNGPSPLEGIPFSWACFLRTPEDFAESVLSAVNLGHNAEGNGALAGSLAGAYRGASGIPDRLLAGIPWRKEAEAAADALLALSRRGATAS